MTKWQTRQALYLLGLTGILYLFSCKSQGISHFPLLRLYLFFFSFRHFALFFTYFFHNIVEILHKKMYNKFYNE